MKAPTAPSILYNISIPASYIPASYVLYPPHTFHTHTTQIGQAISSRPDAVPPMYIRELEKLQDRIPPFSNDDAMRTLANELGTPVDVLFSDMSDAPIAAASLGQVYKARLRATGQQVAVKVQRPGVASAIGLDTYILRFAAAWFKHWRKLNSDLPALIDEWTASLFRELDYRNEAANGVRFRELYGNVEVCERWGGVGVL